MGRVYEALDLSNKRNCALKILHADVAKDAVAVERFRREFDVSKLLSHAHVVDVLDFQPTADETFALAMEFLYGEELRSALKREAVLSPARVVRMLAQLAVGLDDAHSRKLVHRDLKPDNIFLCQTRNGDIIKILDFGSVKDKADNAKKLTVIGTTIGSPFYMAPEQAQGLDTLDHRADVWALAAITYECITGHVPFSGINGPSILLEILTKTPIPPSQRNPAPKYPVPPTLDRVMLQAFQKAPALRTASVGELADRVGQAYGLEGVHNDWIGLTEAEVEAKITERLPSMMIALPEKPEGDGALDDFFGAGGSMLETDARPQPQPRGMLESSVELAGVPKAMPSWVVPVAIVCAILVVVLTVVLVIFL
jgi:serine/threonine-protein kinase